MLGNTDDKCLEQQFNAMFHRYFDERTHCNQTHHYGVIRVFTLDYSFQDYECKLQDEKKRTLRSKSMRLERRVWLSHYCFAFLDDEMIRSVIKSNCFFSAS